MDVAARLLNQRRSTDRQLGELALLQSQKLEAEETIEHLLSEIDILSRSSILLNSLVESRQLRIQSQIENLVTQGLQSIFDSTVSFHMLNSVKANKQEIDLIVRSSLSNGETFDTGILSAQGGGMVDVIGFLLMLTVLLLTKKSSDKMIRLDEAFSHLSKAHRPAAAKLLREIVDRTNTQIVLATHFEDLAETADKVYHFSRSKSGETIIKELS